MSRQAYHKMSRETATKIIEIIDKAIADAWHGSETETESIYRKALGRVHDIVSIEYKLGGAK